MQWLNVIRPNLCWGSCTGPLHQHLDKLVQATWVGNMWASQLTNGGVLLVGEQVRFFLPC